jgi:hypothetical protein
MGSTEVAQGLLMSGTCSNSEDCHASLCKKSLNGLKSLIVANHCWETACDGVDAVWRVASLACGRGQRSV